MKILIAGAGIGGLTAANALAKDGHTVTVLEKTPQPRPVGAGISLQPNAMQCLAKLGLVKAVASRGMTADAAVLRFSNGQVIRTLKFDTFQDKYGFMPYTIHRADLFDLLREGAEAKGVKILFGESVDSVAQREDQVVANHTTGEVVCDLLVGADGLHSKISEQLFGKRAVREAGYVCWRGIVEDPALVELVTDMNELWGRGARFGFMRCSRSKVYWFATRSLTKLQAESQDWHEFFRTWPEPVHRLIRSTNPEQQVFNAIVDREPLTRWSVGNTTLLGDAAHPMTPNFGQGGAQAIEDAMVLAWALREFDDSRQALAAYENVRRKRANKMVVGARRYGKIAQGGSPLTRLIRNHVITRLPDSLMDRELSWQLDYDSQLASMNA